MPLKKIVLFVCCIIVSLIVRGQEKKKNPFSLSFRGHYGFIIPHSGKIEELTDASPFGADVEFARYMLKDKNWKQCNCYSKMGAAFSYVYSTNPDTIGSSYSFIGFAEPFLYRGERLLLSTRMGVGVSYLTKIYDANENPKNKFFSTPISFIIYIDVNAYLALNNKTNLIVFARYSHISNGGIKLPNYGMNFPTLGLGLEYLPNGTVKFKERQKTPYVPDFFYGIYSFGTIKTVAASADYPETQTLIAGIYGFGGRTVSKLNGFSLGLDYTNDGAKKEELARKDIPKDHQQFSFLVGHHLRFGKFDFSQHWGTYLYATDKPRNFFQRYSLSYQFTKHLSGGVTLKAHGDAADNFNVLLGVIF